MDKKQIFEEVKTALIDLFELDPEEVTVEANLFTDLDIDSIDAVDLIAHLKKRTNVSFSPQTFREVRTVGDVVDVIGRTQKT